MYVEGLVSSVQKYLQEKASNSFFLRVSGGGGLA